MTPSSRKQPTTSSPAPCGSSEPRAGRIEAAGAVFAADVSGALWSADASTLVVADLHFEKGSARAARGVHLPPYDTRTTLRGLAAALARYRPRRLIALGDSFHDCGGPARLDADDLAGIRALSESVEIFWVTGNHDPEIPAFVGGRVVSEVAIGGLVFRHEPRPGDHAEVAGHLHPVAAVTSRGRRLRRRCFVSDGRRIVLPAFGAYTGGLNVLSEPFRPLFHGLEFAVWMIGREAVHRVSGRRLGA
jgi:hypothetical protein